VGRAKARGHGPRQNRADHVAELPVGDAADDGSEQHGEHHAPGIRRGDAEALDQRHQVHERNGHAGAAEKHRCAEYRNGVLRVTLPKREETKARRIEIGGEGASGSAKTIEAKAENVGEKSSKAAGGQ